MTWKQSVCHPGSKRRGSDFFSCLLCSVCVAFRLSPLLQGALLTLYMSLYALLRGLCRPSCRSLLSLGGSLPQRDASAGWPLRQNQRRVGDPTGIAAAHQASWERAVWGGLDGYGSSRLLKRGSMEGTTLNQQRHRTHSKTQANNLAWEERGSDEKMGQEILIILSLGLLPGEYFNFLSPPSSKSCGKTSSVSGDSALTVQRWLPSMSLTACPSPL